VPPAAQQLRDRPLVPLTAPLFITRRERRSSRLLGGSACPPPLAGVADRRQQYGDRHDQQARPAECRRLPIWRIGPGEEPDAHGQAQTDEREPSTASAAVMPGSLTSSQRAAASPIAKPKVTRTVSSSVSRGHGSSGCCEYAYASTAAHAGSTKTAARPYRSIRRHHSGVGDAATVTAAASSRTNTAPARAAPRSNAS
jgi:hypothetical protein